MEQEETKRVSRSKRDIAIVGAGVLGLAHAYIAAKLGHRVEVFERNPRAIGASVRNFGMIWPIGQPKGTLLETALRSREIWLELLREAGLPSRQEGSLHVAYRADEVEVIQEFAERGPAFGYDCQFLNREQTLQKSLALQPEGLIGSLWSPAEFTIDSRQVISTLPNFLEEKYGVRFHFSTPVLSVRDRRIRTSRGENEADVVLVCSGDDFETLYPEQFAASGVTRCKLQMMRTIPQPSGWQLGPSLAAGLTLRFYSSFQICDSLQALRKRVAEETPEYDRWAIHALVSQTVDGSLTLGDSHEYGLLVDPFNKEEIDKLILSYTSQFLRVPALQIAQRWQGVYSKHPEKPLLVMQPEPGVRVVTAPSGSGMTLSFGVAERSMRELGFGSVEGAHV
jgi:D-hydroxyproline dehydrogenase subunit beta